MRVYDENRYDVDRYNVDVKEYDLQSFKLSLEDLILKLAFLFSESIGVVLIMKTGKEYKVNLTGTIPNITYRVRYFVNHPYPLFIKNVKEIRISPLFSSTKLVWINPLI